MNTQAKPFELDKNRIEGLNHGIFAIVMTLLIFELKTSDLPQHASNIQLAPALFEMWPFLSLSFMRSFSPYIRSREIFLRKPYPEKYSSHSSGNS
jgi:uncharacterized membrane protein